MAHHRFFLTRPLARDSGAVRADLTADDLHHARAVLRLRREDSIELAEPGGETVWLAQIETLSHDAMTVSVLDRLPVSPQADVALVQAVAKGEKMDLIVRQAVELGASEVYPVLTARTVVRIESSKRGEKGARWRRVAKAAAEQSHRASVPSVYDPCDLRELLPSLERFDHVVLLWEEACSDRPASPVAFEAASHGSTAVIIGPEGGFTAEEVSELEALGAEVASLGRTILRTETAAVVALALALRARGALGGEEPCE